MSGLRDELEAVMAKYVATAGGAQAPQAGGAAGDRAGVPPWLNPPAAVGGLPQPIGWSVPVRLMIAGRSGPEEVVVDVAFPPETFAQAPAVVDAMIAHGFAVKSWSQRQRQFSRGGGYGGGGGGQQQSWGGGWQQGGSR